MLDQGNVSSGELTQVGLGFDLKLHVFVQSGNLHDRKERAVVLEAPLHIANEVFHNLIEWYRDVDP